MDQRSEPAARRVFVLGAGASRKAGFPLASDLFPLVHERLSPQGQEDLERGLRFFYYPALQTSLYRPPDPVAPSTSEDLDDVEMERFMSRLDMAEHFNEIVPITFLTPRYIQSLRANLLRAIATLLLERQSEAEASPERTRYVDNFILRLSPWDTVITFNWDLLFERRLRAHRVEFSLCPARGDTPRLAFLKLHGSIDWYRAADTGFRVDSGLQIVHRQILRTERPELLDEHGSLQEPAVPFIVPPTFYKTFRGCADIEEIWAEALRRLEGAEEIYFCGYRFAPEDLFALFLFRRAIGVNLVYRSRTSPQPLRLISVINPETEPVESVKRDIYADVHHEKAKFENSSLATPLPGKG